MAARTRLCKPNRQQKNGLPRRCTPRNDRVQRGRSSVLLRPLRQRHRSERRGKRGREYNNFRPDSRRGSNSMPIPLPPSSPCAAKRPHGNPSHAEPPAPGQDRSRPLPSYPKPQSNPPVTAPAPSPTPPGRDSKGRGPQPPPFGRFKGVTGGNIGLPPQSKRSVCGGKRRSSGMSELVPAGQRRGIWSL